MVNTNQQQEAFDNAIKGTLEVKQNESTSVEPGWFEEANKMIQAEPSATGE